jgi:hypothetical protein
MAANRLMKWLRRGYDSALKVRKKWPFGYVVETSIKIDGTTIAKFETKLQAKSESHAKQIATAYVRENLKIGYKIHRAKKDKKSRRK